MQEVTTPYSELIAELGYADSGNFVTDPSQLPGCAHLLRTVKDAGVRGAYVFGVASPDGQVRSRRPAIYVAEASDETEAKHIHRLVWNQGAVPFLIVVLPQHVRVYTGFRFDPDGGHDELATVSVDDWSAVRHTLADYFAPRVDIGRLWERADALNPQHRVDVHLLRNLEALGGHLVNDLKVPSDLAHALIGKYIYIRYLKDRKILSAEWLEAEKIDLATVLGREAGLEGLCRLVEALEDRFKGQVFPLRLTGLGAPYDDVRRLDSVVRLVATVFAGDEISTGQLSLDFEPYDFSYIPVELLSSIYEQFLHVEGKGADAGAFYTPEPLADYVLAELDSQHPLASGARILDPCCGSGVFLVLAYRRLIEVARAATPDGILSPEELRAILQTSVFGVERNLEACYVAEFSLILTLLGYVNPPDLHHNRGFEFPSLHNRNIFECDFFDEGCGFASSGLRFDWIVGNPPWLELEADPQNAHTLAWISRNSSIYPVARGRASEAFLWRVTDFLEPQGTVALLVQATSLTNAQSSRFRVDFFSRNEVRRITNFSNLAYALFAGSAETPAASIVYRRARGDAKPPHIVHYAPFAANQLLTRRNPRKRLWAITIFEDEISLVDPQSAATGDGRIWKLALWGTYRDIRTLDRLTSRLPQTLRDLEQQPGWSLSQGLMLRDSKIPATDRTEQFDEIRKLRGKYVLDHRVARRFRWRFSVPRAALARIPNHMCYVREGRTRGMRFLSAPHLWIDVRIAAFSERDFVLRHPLIGLAAPAESADHLRALSIYLNSSLAHYIEFFEAAAWGVDRRRINLNEARRLRVPALDSAQIRRLADLHRELAAAEASSQDTPLFGQEDTQGKVDAVVFETLKIPLSESVVVSEFFQVRLTLDKGKTVTPATARPGTTALRAYARCLRDELDDYAELRHLVTILPDRDLIACVVEVTGEENPVEPVVATDGSSTVYRSIWSAVRERQSQWVYVQRGLRIFDGSRVIVCKSPRLVDWTCTQAMHDSDEIITEIVETVGFDR